MNAAKIGTDEAARAWLVEHIVAPAEAESHDRLSAADPTFCEVLAEYAAAYRTALRPGEERAIVDKIGAFRGPARSFAEIAGRLIVAIRDDATVSLLGTLIAGLPDAGLASAMRRLKPTGIAAAVSWLAALDADERLLRRPAPVLPARRQRKRPAAPAAISAND